MFQIQGLDHLVLRTTMQAKMMAFYCDLLGCTVANEQPELRLIQLRAGQHIIDLVAVDTPVEVGEGNLLHFCLQIKPFDYPALKHYFAEYGIAVERYGNRFGAQGMANSFYIHDPEGNEVELVEVQKNNLGQD